MQTKTLIKKIIMYCAHKHSLHNHEWANGHHHFTCGDWKEEVHTFNWQKYKTSC